MTYPDDYATARDRFRQAAHTAGAHREAHAIGAAGDDLTIDVARVGPANAPRLIVLSSGLHGVEGPFGSAVQVATLEGEIAHTLPGDAALLLIHALNPYGFAHSRRFNEDNVDLNRNFLRDGEPYAGSPPGYAELSPLINPVGPPTRLDLSRLQALWAIARHGLPTLKRAIAVGQHDQPRGLFFGGKGPSRTRQVLAAHLRRWIGSARSVVHLDFHTGLGRWCEYRLLIPTATAPSLPRLASAFRPEVLELDSLGPTAYPSRGDLLPWMAAELPASCDYGGLLAEFGTYPALEMLSALRAENRAHHWGTDADRSRARARLREAFVPADRRWRERTLADGLDLVRRAFLL